MVRNGVLTGWTACIHTLSLSRFILFIYSLIHSFIHSFIFLSFPFYTCVSSLSYAKDTLTTCSSGGLAQELPLALSALPIHLALRLISTSTFLKTLQCVAAQTRKNTEFLGYLDGDAFDFSLITLLNNVIQPKSQKNLNSLKEPFWIILMTFKKLSTWIQKSFSVHLSREDLVYSLREMVRWTVVLRIQTLMMKQSFGR